MEETFSVPNNLVAMSDTGWPVADHLEPIPTSVK